MAYVFQTKTKDGKPHPRWRFEFRDYRGRKKKGTGFTSKAQTLKYVRELEAREDAIRKGFREPPKPKIPDREFKAAAREYLAWGDSQGGRGGRPWGERHSLTRHRHMRWWTERLGFRLLSELDGCLPLVEAELRALQGKGLAGRTVAQHAKSIKAFAKWCHTRHFIENDPLVALTGFDTTPQSTRRAMTVDEVQRLLGVVSVERKILYEVALCTGLRANELRNLTTAHLDAGQGGLRLDAAWTKNRRAGFQPVPEELLQRLLRFEEEGTVADRYGLTHGRFDATEAPSNPLLYIQKDPAKAFTKDLAKAGIPKHTKEGKLDFHALRVTYTTLVIEAGATVKEAQTLLRHSNPQLTMNIYARTREGRLADVTENVGRVVMAGHERASSGHQVAPKGKRRQEERFGK
jgi:integrase